MKKRPTLRAGGAMLTTFLLLLFAACRHNERPAAPTHGKLKVGAILPLTGPAAHIGTWQRNGLQVAAADASKTLGDRQLEMVIEDSKGNATDGLAAINKLITVDDVDVVIASTSAVANPLLPVADRNHRPFIMISVSYPGIAERSPWAFRDHPGSEDEARSMVKYLSGRTDIRKLAVFYINDDFGRGGQAVFEQDLRKTGRDIVFSESYEKTGNDFKAELVRALATKPDAFYVIGYVDASAVLIKQLREAGFKGLLACNMAMAVPQYLQSVGAGFDNSVFTVSEFSVDSRNPATQAFVQKYRKASGAEPTAFSAMAYDGLGMLAMVVARKGTDRDAIRDGLSHIENYAGAMGTLRVDFGRNVVFPLHTAKYANGKLQVIQE